MRHVKQILENTSLRNDFAHLSDHFSIIPTVVQSLEEKLIIRKKNSTITDTTDNLNARLKRDTIHKCKKLVNSDIGLKTLQAIAKIINEYYTSWCFCSKYSVF